MAALLIRTAETLDALDTSLPPGHWCVLLAMDATNVSVDDISGVLVRLLDAGMVYLCTWGPDCERVHDICDEDLVMQEIDGKRPEASDTDHVMTTWHSDEPLADAAWFAVHTAKPAEDYEATFAGTIAMLVGLDADAATQVTAGVEAETTTEESPAEPSDPHTFRDSAAVLVEVCAMVVLIVAGVRWGMRAEGWWIASFVVFITAMMAGLIHVVSRLTIVRLTGKRVSITRPFERLDLPWDEIRACDFDRREGRFAIHRRASGERGKWLPMTRGSDRVFGEMLERAQAKGSPLDPLVRLSGIGPSAFDMASFQDRYRTAWRDIAVETGHEDLAERFTDDNEEREARDALADRVKGAGEIVQALVIDRAYAAVERDDNPLPYVWPMWVGAVGLLSAAVVSAIATTQPLSGRALAIALFGWIFVTATYKLITPLVIAYVVGAILVAGYVALIIAAVMDFEEARLAFVVITGGGLLLTLLTLAAHGEFDGW